jgi:hypothetical protein
MASQQPKGQSLGPHFLAAPQETAVLIVRPKKRPTIIHFAVVIVRVPQPRRPTLHNMPERVSAANW